jgi:hypothetical protein
MCPQALSLSKSDFNSLRLLTNINSNSITGDSAVGIATRYGMEGPGIESRWGRDFPHLSRPAPRPT